MSNEERNQNEQDPEVEPASIRVLLLRSGGDDIPLDFDEFPPPSDPKFEDSVMEVAGMLYREKAPSNLWVRLVEEVWRFNKYRLALDILDRALDLNHYHDRDSESHIPLHCLVANYNMALARKAPKLILQSPKSNHGQRLGHNMHQDHPEYTIEDPNAPPLTKDAYLKRAGDALRTAEQIEGRIARSATTEKPATKYPIILDVRAAHAVISGRFDDALKLFDRILSQEPTNLPALMGRARCLFGKKSYRLSLKSYQTVLAYAPNLLPDPRIGIGLCMYMLDERDTARLAWERSIVANPDSLSGTAKTLLSLYHIHDSKSGSDEARSAVYNIGVKYAEAAFKVDNTSATAAATLASFFAIKGDNEKAIKIGERAVQYSDNARLRSDAHLTIARILHRQGNPKYVEEYTSAIKTNPEQTPAHLAIAQVSIAKGEFPVATDILESVLRRQPQCIEALVSLAAIHTQQAFTNLDVADSKVEQKQAKELYDQVLRLFASEKDTSTEVIGEPKLKSLRISEIAHDPEMYLEIAKLYSDEANLDRSLKCYKEAAKITSEELQLPVSPKVLNNIGVLEYMRGNLLGAQDRFEEAATEAGNLMTKEGGASDQLDAIITAVTFNLGVVYGGLGDKEKAKSAFNQIISKHPEYVDAKAHLALTAMAAKEYDEAHNYIKEALTSQPKNAELRALYTYFLVETGAPKAASDFTLDTLKSHNRHDVYALCATGMLTYIRVRENKDVSKEADQDRATRYLRTAEYFEKALTLDPQCAFAAQGLAISIADGTLGTGIEASASAPITDHAQKAKNSRDALTILTKVKGSINNGSVYINIGHCHFMRDEWERAIESYETASKRYYDGKNINCLLYLSRSWFHKGNKDKNYSDLRNALAASKKALALSPNDLSIIFNVAMIQQKALETLYEIPPHRRTLAELHQALEDGEESQQLFERLATDTADITPYIRELPRQRQSYGVGLLKRSAKILATQEEHELEEQARLDKAKEIRDLERKRIADEEESKLAEQARQAELLAEQRRAMGEESAAWVSAAKYISEDEEDKKSKKRKPKSKREEGEGGEGEEESGEEEEKPKKKKAKASTSKKSKKARASEGSAEPQGMELDEDGEEKVVSKKRKGKAFKSSEFIESSESESEAEAEVSNEKDMKSDNEEEEAVESEPEAQSPKEDEE